MDTGQEQLLISEIYDRPLIWDKRDSQYKNSYKKGKEWDAISSKLRFDKTVLKNKWRSLTTKFRTECNLERMCRSGHGAEDSYQSQWPHFHALKFLKDSSDPVDSTGNFDELFQEQFDEEEEELYENIPPNKQTAMPKSTKSPENNRGPSKRNPVIDQKTPKKPATLADDVSDMSDADVLFFKTLACHVKKIDEERKLQFRNEVNNVVYKYVYGSSTAAAEKRSIEDSNDDCILLEELTTIKKGVTTIKKEKKEKKFKPTEDMTNVFNETCGPENGYPSLSPMLGAAFYNQMLNSNMMMNPFLIAQQILTGQHVQHHPTLNTQYQQVHHATANTQYQEVQQHGISDTEQETASTCNPSKSDNMESSSSAQLNLHVAGTEQFHRMAHPQKEVRVPITATNATQYAHPQQLNQQAASFFNQPKQTTGQFQFPLYNEPSGDEMINYEMLSTVKKV